MNAGKTTQGVKYSCRSYTCTVYAIIWMHKIIEQEELIIGKCSQIGTELLLDSYNLVGAHTSVNTS